MNVKGEFAYLIHEDFESSYSSCIKTFSANNRDFSMKES